MKRAVWLTDIHLNFVDPPQLQDFLDHIKDSAAELILISGDIAESPSVTDYLNLLSRHLQVPIYFVLGNHDFYFGAIAPTRARVHARCSSDPYLHYLTDNEVRELTPHTGLLGHDGWADARFGDYEHSTVALNDYRVIQDFQGLDKQQRRRLLEQLGDEAADSIQRRLPEAMERFEEVYLVTHVPPLREACWHEGRTAHDHWAPHFACKAMGDVLLQVAAAYPDRHLIVLCGHTHSGGEIRPADNVLIITGGAEYCFPGINRLFTIY